MILRGRSFLVLRIRVMHSSRRHFGCVDQVLERLIEFRHKPNQVSSNRVAVEAEGEEVYNKDWDELEK
ncbi:hypothetical protein EV2_039476 [Malus domestica]